MTLYNISQILYEGERMPFVTINVLEGKGKDYIKKFLTV